MPKTQLKVQPFLLLVLLTIFSGSHQVKIEKQDNPDIDTVETFLNTRRTNPVSNIEEQWESYLHSSMNNFTPQEKRCMTLRRHLSTLPSTETSSGVISFFQNLFKKRRIMNYRKASYDIIMGAEDYDDMPEIKYMKGIIPQLYRLKMEYYSKYPRSSLLRGDGVELEDLEKDLEMTKEMAATAESRINEINGKKTECNKELEEVVKALKDPGSEVTQKMKTVVWWEKLQTHIYNASSISDLSDSITLQMYKEIIPDYEETLDKFYGLLEKFDFLDKMKLHLRHVSMALKDFTSPSIKNAYERINPLILGLADIEEEMDDELEDEREILFSAMQAKITEVFFQIRGDATLIRYQELLGERVEYEDELTPLISEVLNFQNKIMELQLKLGTLSEEIRKTFVVSKKDISDMEITLMHLDENTEWAKELKKEECPPDADEEQQVVIQSKNFIAQFRGYITSHAKRQKREMAFLKQIYELEKKVDSTMGLLFASVFVLKSDLRCFTASELSYFFFNMFKTNFIIDETQFMKSFLTALPQPRARSFIILNYTIFTNEGYVNKIIKQNRPSVTANLIYKDMSKMIDEFAINNSIMVNLYKNYIKSEYQNHQENVENGSIGSIIFHVLYFMKDTYNQEMNNTSIAMMVNVLTGIIWGMVPFINHIMFLQTLVNKFLFLFFSFIRTMISKFMKIGKDKMNMVMKKLGQNIMSSDFTTYTYDLDFEKVIEDQKAKDPEPEMTISFRQVEDLYFKYFNDNSVLVKAEKINLFSPDEFLPKEDEVIELDQKIVADDGDPSDVQDEDIIE